jgi:hypothetical protein
MGSRKFITVLLFMMILFNCYANKNVSISNCVITENNIIIDIDFKNVKIFRIREVSIDYKNIPIHIWFSGDEEITYYKTESKIVICLDLTDKILYTNEEATLSIKVSGGFIYGDIIIENSSSEREQFYTFPNNTYENLNINILKQGYGLNI